MSTNDVPGANPANKDVLAAGAWAEHADGSLVFVKGTENNQVVFEIYDRNQDPVVYYQDAMREDAFKTAFSHPPIGDSDIDWVWHDKTPFPWSRVMKLVDKPTPVHADVHEALSAAAKIAKALRLRAQKLDPDKAVRLSEREESKGRGIVDRIQKALDAFLEA